MTGLSIAVFESQIECALFGTRGADLNIEASAALVDVFNSSLSIWALKHIGDEIGCEFDDHRYSSKNVNEMWRIGSYEFGDRITPDPVKAVAAMNDSRNDEQGTLARTVCRLMRR
jgi:hypothetical protein